MKAHLSVVPNKNSKTSSISFYHELTLEDGSRFLFTESQIASAEDRAWRNLEDLTPFEDLFPVEVEKPSFFKKLFG
jgi:hypothetical protein